MDQLSLDVVVTRGALVESQHRVHAAVVDASGRLIGVAREAGMVTHWRSCAKPFQVMPLIESGGFDRIGWGDDQLALACASHGGEPEHVAVAQAMLTSIGMEEGDLACGPHDPLAQRGQKLLRESGHRPGRLHNNCSGKHAAMLAHAHTNGWPAVGYERQEHRVQRDGLSEVAVPLMLGGSPAHSLAPELTLRPVLTEIGGVVATRGLYVVDSAHDDPAAYAHWLELSRPVVAAILAGREAASA